MPLVLTNSGAVFLHIPKTGGTWLRFALVRAGVDWKDVGPQHATTAESSWVSPGKPRFTILRNPLEWYASYWAMRQYERNKGGFIIDHDCLSSNFNTFVELVCLKHPGFLTKLYASYIDDSTILLRNEALAEDLVVLLKVLGERFDEQRLLDTPITNPGASLPRYKTLTKYSPQMKHSLTRAEKNLFLACYPEQLA